MFLDRKMQSTCVAAAACALALLLPSGPGRANESLRPSLGEMGEEIAKLLKGRNENTIAVGAFTGPAKFSTSAGPGIKRIFIEELEKHQVRVDNKAKLEIKGDYLNVTNPANNEMSLRLKASVLDDQGQVLVVFDKMVENLDVLAQVLGITRSDLGGGLARAKKSAELKKRMDNPSVDIKDARIQASASSPFSIEIEIKAAAAYKPRVPTQADGRAFVHIDRGEVFGVRLNNDSEHDAAVELTLDSLSMFTFSEVKGYRFVMVPKKGSTLIKGWYVNNKISNEFLISEYSKSAAAEMLKNPDDVGTITATFSKAWDPKGDAPDDERAGFRGDDDNAVARGKTVESKFQEVERTRGRVRDIISVRYKKAEK